MAAARFARAERSAISNGSWSMRNNTWPFLTALLSVTPTNSTWPVTSGAICTRKLSTAAWEETWRTLDLNAMHPEHGVVRYEVEVLEKGELPQGGSFIAVAVRIPQGPTVDGPYRNENAALCLHHRAEDDVYVSTSLRVNMAGPEAGGWSTLLEGCKATRRTS